MSDALFEVTIPAPAPPGDSLPPLLWPDVRPRLAALAARPGAAAIFGATGHRWKLEPPLAIFELAEVETQLGLSLPADYRAFLLQAGRGGAGPAYGLFPLGRESGRWHWTGGGASDGDSGPLTRPFAHIRAFNPFDELPARPEGGAADDEWWERYEDAVYDPAHSHGLLYLSHLGCALREALVTTGPSRGQMWADYMAEGDGFHPLQNPDGTRMTFTDWYRTWLTAAERTLDEACRTSSPK
ncbi:SMI1/KNR4 family protein [Actinoplanes derwentensis]|uniref:SMI1/KNR4 family protein n=1 Tax=Actinoplanes derwentensis TaxID=113562 RepID=UPI001E63F313|nr:SMI1/KNR4 family protein [Actinoplanes derwentensis]